MDKRNYGNGACPDNQLRGSRFLAMFLDMLSKLKAKQPNR
jgi:hypothetical protein